MTHIPQTFPASACGSGALLGPSVLSLVLWPGVDLPWKDVKNEAYKQLVQKTCLSIFDENPCFISNDPFDQNNKNPCKNTIIAHNIIDLSPCLSPVPWLDSEHGLQALLCEHRQGWHRTGTVLAQLINELINTCQESILTEKDCVICFLNSCMFSGAMLAWRSTFWDTTHFRPVWDFNKIMW